MIINLRQNSQLNIRKTLTCEQRGVKDLSIVLREHSVCSNLERAHMTVGEI